MTSEPNTHCRIGKIKKRRDLKVVELGEYNDNVDASWRWPLLEALELENVKDVMVIATIRDANGNTLIHLCNSAKIDRQLGLIERAKQNIVRLGWGF